MDAAKPSFRPFDREADVYIKERNLPHWFQPEVAIFITFRTIDSLPNEVILRLQRELAEWLVAKGLPVELSSWDTSTISPEHQRQLAALPILEQKEFKRLRDKAFHRGLDECHGECLLTDRELALIVADAIFYHHGKAHDLDSFIIMPNHVHAIVQFRSGYDLKIVGQSWMRYSARLINEHLGRKGPFWQGEPFDHLIRSDQQFRYLQNYIARNADQARLEPGKALYWNTDLPRPE